MHKQLVDQFIELMNSGQANRFGEVIAENYVQHNSMVEQGLVSIQNGAKWFATLFPDAHAVVDVVVAEGDLVVARFTWTGTHEGELMGVSATYRRVSWTGTDWWRVENGKFIEHWDIVDWAALMQQLTQTT